MLKRIQRAFQTQPPVEPIQDSKEVAEKYRYWRFRIMYGMMFGYASYYFVRKNISMANLEISKELNFSATDMGLILSGASIVYAFSKFFNGVLSDRLNPRYLMGTGLVLAAAMNYFFGMSSALWLLVLFWALNNLFQGMGMPPCSKLLTNWYSPTELGSAWGIWNASHQIGSATIVVFTGYLVAQYGWRSAFYVPATIALVMSLFIFNRLRDNPQSLGLPPVGIYKGDVSPKTEEELAKDREQKPFWEIFKKHILKNKMVWIVCFANFFIYIVRIGVLDWAPRFLQEAKGFSIESSGLSSASYEVMGIIGALAAGWISDKVFKGRRGPVAVVLLAALIFFIYGLIYIPTGEHLLITLSLMGIGFCVYGPQMLVAVAAADFATTEATATAVGLTGFFGYMGAAVCGVGTGYLKDNYGWNGSFWFWILSAAIAMLLFMLIWKQRSPMLEDIHNGNSEAE